MRITLDQLVENLSSSGLLSAEEASAICEGLSATDGAAESEAAAQELAGTGKLTAFQAERICEGHTSGLVFGEYVVLDKIGAGGMGEVYKARHRTMDREVAIKVLPEKQMDTPDAVKRFNKEVRAAAKLHHPNIVTAHDAGHKGDLHFLVMEYVEGRDLSDIVDDGGPLPVDQAMNVILQAARGLEYAHGEGITHRDIKPANLLLDKKGTVKILDMGLARVESGTGEADAGAGLTSTGQIMGTSDYIPPEQAMDTRKADARSDVYSLGCTLYRLLTGNTPYSGDTVMKKIMAHMSDPIPSLREARSDMPEPLDELYQRMLAKEPNDRPQTMTEVIAALEDIIRGCSTKSSEDSASGGAAPDVELASFFDQMSHAPAAPSISSRAGPKAGTAKTATPVKGKTEPVAEETIDLPSQDDTSRSVTAAEAAVTKVPAPQPEAAKKPAPKPRKRASVQVKKQRRQLQLIGIGVGLSLIGAAIVAAVIYVQTNRGTIIVDARDEDIQVSVQRGGEEVDVIDANDHWRIKAKSGEYHVEIKGGHDRLTLDKDTVTVTRGGELRVRVELKPTQAAKGRGPPPTLAKAPFDATQAKKHQQAWAEYLGLPVEKHFDLPGGEKLTMVLIPPGEFLMGSTEEEQARFMEEARAADAQGAIDRIPSEGPQHRVRITRPFYLGKYEVTQAQWEAVMGDNPSDFKGNPSHPVEQVSWDDMRPFLEKLNAAGTLRLFSGKSTLAGECLEFSLPTEAHWEYACRAGTATSRHNDDTEEGLRESSWFNGNSGGKTHPVGQLKANAWGLYDMYGNVSEWCADWYGADYYRQSPTNDPEGPATGSERVRRGVGWQDHAMRCRSADRHKCSPDYRYNGLGLRLACNIQYPPPGTKPAVPAISPSQASGERPPGKGPDGESSPTGGDAAAPPSASLNDLPPWQLPPDAPKPAIAPFDAVQAKEHQEAWADYLGLTVEKDFELPGGEKLTMMLIPPGEFLMGSTEEDQVQVYLTKPFYLGKYEVTQSEWKAVMSNNLSRFQDDRNPVEMVNWNDCTAFIAKLQLQLADSESGIEFALPTAAQWEYACQAGAQTRFYFGEDPRGTELVDYAWYEANSDCRTHPVGEKVPNAWGLYDMHGNVSEWCQDWSGAYQAGDPKNPSGPMSGKYRVRRGGGWNDSGKYCRSAHRYRKDPGQRTGDIGLRVALNLSKVGASRLPQTTEVAPF